MEAERGLQPGLKLSKGDYIAIQEGDDFWPPDKLEIQMKAFRGNEGGLELERVKYAYATDEKDPKAFSSVPSIRIDPEAVSPSGRPVMRLGGSRGVARMENETAAIS